MDHGGIYGLENVSITALFRFIQNIANAFHLVYLVYEQPSCSPHYSVRDLFFSLSTVLLTQM